MDEQQIARLKAKAWQKYEKDIAAIDRVASLIDEDEPAENAPQTSAEQSESQEKPNANEFALSSPSQDKDKDKSSQNKLPQLRPVVRELKHLLPAKFTKYDVAKIVIENKPEFDGRIGDNALSGSMSALVEEKFAVVEEEARGRKAAIYRRLDAN